MGRKVQGKKLVLAAILGVALVKLIAYIPQPDVYWNNKVYVAFGFHGNLYHSFRGDTADESGFGRDIRVIRHIIKTLDRFNDEGVPVRASWDFDNHFSLENILPVHAPDILTDIRRRVDQGQDEVLLMSYNNGLASAMTPQELKDTVQWAVSNPWGSGVKDIFGSYTPVVRPQEMMTTPGSFDIYRQAGIKAVSLYYSATPFDTFRLFVRKLTRSEAYNPLVYENAAGGEELLVIPTYNIGDLVENTSLAHWVEQLHEGQRQGKIKRDVLVFINFDADSEYWTGAAQLKWPLNRLPNTTGLEGLIREVKDKNYVRFTTLKDYLADHGHDGRISFQQDTADGSFDGYNSWSEKKGSTDAWTRIQTARQIHAAAQKAVLLLDDSTFSDRIEPLLDEAYLVRLKAMSTTHFGMATPFLAPQREKERDRVLDRLDRLGTQIRQEIRQEIGRKIGQVLASRERNGGALPWGWADLGPLMVVSPEEGARGQSGYLRLPLDRVGRILLRDKETRFYLKRFQKKQVNRINKENKDNQDNQEEIYSLTPLPGGLTSDPLGFFATPEVPDGLYCLCAGPGPKTALPFPSVVSDEDGAMLENKEISLSFGPDGRPEHLYYKGQPVLEPERLVPRFMYEGQAYAPDTLDVTTGLGPGKIEYLDVKGDWFGPEGRTLSKGSVHLSYALVPGQPYLFITGEIHYPATTSPDLMKADVKSLARQMDMGWEEVVPCELALVSRANARNAARILKTNYLGVDSAYPLDYFRHSSQNLNIDNANNQITPGMVAVVAGGQGMALGFDQSVAANFAGVPARVRYHDNPGTSGKNDLSGTFSVSLNPFGTYYGRQNRRPTWGNGLGHEAALISGEQYHSAAPTFNGKSSRFSLMIGFFEGENLPEKMADDLKAFSNPAVVIAPAANTTAGGEDLSPKAPTAYTASMDKGWVRLAWAPVKGENIEYTVRMGIRSGSYPHVFRTDKPHLKIRGISPHQAFSSGQRYYAVIEAWVGGNHVPVRTPEICLDILDGNHISAKTRIPWKFSLKVIWASLKSAFF